jgi:dihydroorotate dehydrogenase
MLYNVKESYEWNFANPPKCENPIEYTTKPEFEFYGVPVQSLAGIPAGPLLNSEFIKYAIQIGSNINTYKTVRGVQRNCLQFPNCAYISEDAMVYPNGTAVASLDKVSDTITNSFGMPSSAPEGVNGWMQDVEKAQRYTDADGNSAMIVSVVGTPDESNSENQLAADYAMTAKMAVEAGAKVIECNYSCPNVGKRLGAIYTFPKLSAKITNAVRKEMKDNIPVLIKVGYDASTSNVHDLILENLKAGMSGVVGINTISMTIVDENRDELLPGRKTSGCCGGQIVEFAEEWFDVVAKFRENQNLDFAIGSVGGMVASSDITDRLAGDFTEQRKLDFAQLATGAILDSEIFRYFHFLNSRCNQM